MATRGRSGIRQAAGKTACIDLEYVTSNLMKLRGYFNQTIVGDCWNSGKIKTSLVSFMLFLSTLKCVLR